MQLFQVNEFLCEVGQLKDRQEDMDGKLDTMRTENEALWGEVLNLRQKHTQQQKIVNKLIQFLVALVQPRMGTGIKRRFRPGVQGLQLAIEEASPKAKEPRLEQTEEGPVIQEISEEMTGAKLSDLLSRVPVGSVHEITVNAPVSSAEDTESDSGIGTYSFYCYTIVKWNRFHELKEQANTKIYSSPNTTSP